ncbi:hypothetical protein GCM10007036_33260 [Alsobacter metallidurans]|uniref:Uncharacterized protein n=1 Tax=Alsobacter metallidurans TaxID=340221 RepID=A0A917IAC4_9HYPH|nr:hypothetical protein [Alsobacter metallidurans]GGH25864.1 hypothetical protein GCM10007036_33260 [Alsobacter metallidurans]
MPPASSLSDTVAYARRTATAVAAPAPETHTLRAAALVLAGGLVVGSSAFAFSALRPEPARLVTASVGRVSVSVPSQLIRNPAQRKDGPRQRLDLALSWPNLDAAKPVAPAAAAKAPLALGDVLLVTILQADDGPDAGTRAAELYGRYLESAVEEGPGGLISRRFRAKSPYAGEQLLLAPPDGRRFAARCDVEGRAADGLPDVCIAEFRRDGLDIQMRMESRLLEHWEAIDERLRRLLDKIIG